MRKRKTAWEVCFVEAGITEYWTTKQCKEFFGKENWIEYKLGYAPDVGVYKVLLAELDSDVFEDSQRKWKERNEVC